MDITGRRTLPRARTHAQTNHCTQHHISSPLFSSQLWRPLSHCHVISLLSLLFVLNLFGDPRLRRPPSPPLLKWEGVSCIQQCTLPAHPRPPANPLSMADGSSSPNVASGVHVRVHACVFACVCFVLPWSPVQSADYINCRHERADSPKQPCSPLNESVRVPVGFRRAAPFVRRCTLFEV